MYNPLKNLLFFIPFYNIYNILYFNMFTFYFIYKTFIQLLH